MKTIEAQTKLKHSILTLSDYRSFLCAYAEGKRIQNNAWNYSTWARALGLKSTSSITKVLSGERKPGAEMVDRFVQYFKFTPEEERHFRNLILLEKDKTAQGLQYLIQATNEKKHTLQRRVMDLFEFRLIAEWHHLSIRELFRLKNLKLTPKMIQKIFYTDLTESTIQKSISLLQSLSLLKQNPNGNLEARDEQIMTTNDISNDAIKRYHEQMLEQAKQRLHDTKIIEREFQALTLLMDSKNLPKLKSRLRNFIQELEAEFKTEKADQLYQVQMQLFPITKPLDKPHNFN